MMENSRDTESNPDKILLEANSLRLKTESKTRNLLQVTKQ